MTTHRDSLDRQMRTTLARLELISTIPSSNPNNTGRGSDEHPGGRRPPGDTGHETYATWYGPPFRPATTSSCRNDQEREHCIQAAQTELDHLRKGQAGQITETPEHTTADLLRETQGWSLTEIATSHWRITPSIMRRIRVANGLDATNGHQPPPLPDDLDIARKAAHYKAQGMSIRQIALTLGLKHKTQVERYLKMVA